MHAVHGSYVAAVDIFGRHSTFVNTSPFAPFATSLLYSSIGIALIRTDQGSYCFSRVAFDCIARIRIADKKSRHKF